MKFAFTPVDPFALPAHGGDLATAEIRFGRPEGGWLDLSTGINPFAYPLEDISPAECRRLPDLALEAGLRATAAALYGASDAEQVVAAAGTQALIQLLPRFRPLSRVAIVGPTYSEHANSWSQIGHQVVPCESLDHVGEADVVVVVNPNNPDGRLYDRQYLADCADVLASRGGLLVVDEAFVDSTPELSVVPLARPGLVVLRSFGKFFGLAGLRLGFAIAEVPLARALRTSLGPWAISTPALLAGSAAMADTEWIAATRRSLAEEAATLDRLLAGAQLSVIGGTTLFRLVNAPRAWALYEHLGQRGILVRPFADSPRWLRIGLPGGEGPRARLGQALAEWTE